jgi:hypothetical protein
MTTAIEGLWKAAAGEVGMHSAMGRWIQRISTEFGKLVNQGSGVAAQLENLTNLVNAIIAGGNRFAEKSYGFSGIPSLNAGSSEDVPVEVLFNTVLPNEKVDVAFSVERFNAAANGAGEYQFKLDGVLVGVLHTVEGTQRTTIAMNDVLTVATPGAHALRVQVTAVTNTETVSDSSELQAVGQGVV